MKIKKNKVANQNNTLSTGIQQMNATMQDMLPQNKQCRICLQSQDQTNIIIPCKCLGSIKFVHEACLRQWIHRNKQKQLNYIKCQICKYDIQILLKIQWRCRTCQKFKYRVSQAKVFFFFLTLMFIISTSFLCFVISLLCTLQQDFQILSLIMLTLTSIALLFVIIFTLFRILIQFLIYSQQIIEKIKQYKQQNKNQSKSKISAQTFIQRIQ